MTNSPALDFEALSDVTICAVTKKNTIAEIEDLLKRMPQIRDIGENRYPNCKEKFEHFKGLRKHFIGPLQSNKIFRIVSCCDVIQSVENFDQLLKINESAKKLHKNIKFLLQINISGDPAKHGIRTEEVRNFVKKYLDSKYLPVHDPSTASVDVSSTISPDYTIAAPVSPPLLSNVRLMGLMTIGEQAEVADRFLYFSKLKELFDDLNLTAFRDHPLAVLSMGMSDDYHEAIRAGATMVRMGTILFGNLA